MINGAIQTLSGSLPRYGLPQNLGNLIKSCDVVETGACSTSSFKPFAGDVYSMKIWDRILPIHSHVTGAEPAVSG